MGYVSRTLMTISLLVISLLLLVLVASVQIKLGSLCKGDDERPACKRGTLDTLLITCLILGLLGLFLAGFKLYTKTTAVADQVSD